MKHFGKRLWRWSAAAFAAAVILMATMVGLFRVLAPSVPEYRQQIQDWASASIGFPVRIGAMSARWRLLGPEVDLDRVVLLGRKGKRTVATTEQIRIEISLWQLLSRRAFAPSRIILVHPHIDLDRKPDGSVAVRGLDLQPTPGEDKAQTLGQVMGALLGHGAIEVLGATIRWFDPRLPDGSWTFSDIGGELDSTGDNHRLRLATALPATLGRDFRLDIRADGPASAPEKWSWQLDLAGRGLQVPELARLSGLTSTQFRSGDADLRLALSGHGRDLRSAHGQLDARQVFARETSPQAGPPGALAPGFTHLGLRASWVRSAAGWNLTLDDIDVARDGQSWPPTTLEISKEARADASGRSQWHVQGGFVRLQDLALLASWLPARMPGLDRLDALAPKGDVSEFHLVYAPADNGQAKYSIGGHFADIGLSADGALPGLSGLSGRLALDQDGGLLTVDSHDVSLDLPHLFRGPLQATSLAGDFHFIRDGAGWRLSSDDIRVANDAATATATLDFRQPADGSAPLLDLQATAHDADLAQKSAYLPAGIMPKAVVDWLDSAIISGSAPQAHFVFRGHPGDFPFRDGSGLFEVDFTIQHALLDYGNGWPPVRDLAAHVLFHNEGLTVTAKGGDVSGAPVAGVVARFPDLADGDLEIRGRTAAVAANLVQFIQHSPLGKRFGPYVSKLHASGPAPVDIDIGIPVYDIERFKLDGTVHLGGVDAGLAGLGPEVRDIRGDLHFTGHGLSAKGIKARFLGTPVTASAAPSEKSGEDVTRVTVRGHTTAEELAKGLKLEFPARVTGGAAWTLGVDLPNTPDPKGAGLKFRLASDLKGLAVKLPAPFGKEAPQTARATVSLQFLKGDKAGLQVAYGKQAAASCRLDTGTRWQLDRCNLHLGGGAATLPQIAGLTVTGRMPKLVLSDWLRGGTGRVSDFFKALRVHIATLDAWGVVVKGIDLGLTRTDNSWLLRAEAKKLKGTAVIPFARSGTHPVVIDIDHADLPAVAGDSGDEASASDPRQLPAVQLNAQQLRFAGMDMGKVEAHLVPTPEGVALSHFQAVRDDSTLEATGKWIVDAKHQQSGTLDAKVHSTDVEKTLKAYGFNAGVTGSKADATAKLAWTGPPGKGLLKRLGGKVQLSVEDGQLQDVQPGAGRVFGLLSFNALPRRLLLDFSDVFKKGFGFDSIKGDFLLEDGNAYTTDLKLSGPAADIHMLGRTGLVAHDYDQIVIVDSSLSSSIPVAGAIAAGTGVGAVLLVLSEIFKKPLQKVGQVQYHITGSWEHPQVTKITADAGKSGG